MDTNIDDYTTNDLYEILKLDIDTATIDDIVNETNRYIQLFQKNPEQSDFFFNMQKRLLDELNNVSQSDIWNQHNSIPQSDNSVQKDKNTERTQNQSEVDQTPHSIIKQKQLGVTNAIGIPVAQDTLNPSLKNTISYFVNIDSQFRPFLSTQSTNYTIDVSEPLNKVISLTLYSIQIPFTWYVINTLYGNTCMFLTNKGNSFTISVNSGNYSPDTFIIELTNAFLKAGFSSSPTITYNLNNGKLTFQFAPTITDPSGNLIQMISSTNINEFNNQINAYFTFFDVTGTLKCNNTTTINAGNPNNFTINNSLGWLIGFRNDIEPIVTEGNTANATLDLYGSKYFILVIDDLNQNHINNGLISITNPTTTLAIPSYYNPNLPQVLIQNGLFDKTPQVLPTAPRILTQAQIYTCNEILKNRDNNTTFKTTAPTTSDTFAIIPIKKIGLKLGDVYVEFGGTVQNNKRVYFGPVNISRLRVQLLDDKGFIVDLNGADWCFTLLAESLYQY